MHITCPTSHLSEKVEFCRTSRMSHFFNISVVQCLTCLISHLSGYKENLFNCPLSIISELFYFWNTEMLGYWDVALREFWKDEIFCLSEEPSICQTNEMSDYCDVGKLCWHLHLCLRFFRQEVKEALHKVESFFNEITVQNLQCFRNKMVQNK